MHPSPSFWPEASLQRTDIKFQFRGTDHLGHLVAPSEAVGPCPLVLVIHNYQGLKFFDVDVAEYLARQIDSSQCPVGWNVRPVQQDLVA